jgi:hypothetical protein
MAIVKLEVSLPDHLLQPFLQHLRNYESAHSEFVHAAILITDSGAMTMDEVESILRSLRPPFKFFDKEVIGSA